MREGLTLIIALLILGILFDGLRRVRANRRESLKMKRNVSREGEGLSDIDETLSASEFPSGGARVASYRDPKDLEQVNQNLRQSYHASKLTRGAPNRFPEQVSLNLDQPAEAENALSEEPSVLQGSSSEDESKSDTHESDTKVVADAAASEVVTAEEELQPSGEPSLGDMNDLDAEPEADQSKPVTGSEAPIADEQKPIVLETESSETVAEDPVMGEASITVSESSTVLESSPVNLKTEGGDAQGQSTSHHELTESDREPMELKPEPVKSKGFWGSKKEPAPKEPEPQERNPDEVLIINVMAKRNSVFSGPALLDAMVNQGLKFGDMDIFHRHESADGEGRILFSVANIVVPGTFEVGAMEDFETPGISMFLTLPCPGDSISAFNLMAEAAQAIAGQLGGDLKDEQRNVMTRQTIEHARQRVLEYERKRRLNK